MQLHKETRTMSFCIPFPAYQACFENMTKSSRVVKKEADYVRIAEYVTSKVLKDFFDRTNLSGFKTSIMGEGWEAFLTIVVPHHFRKFEIWPDMLKVSFLMTLETDLHKFASTVCKVREALADRFQAIACAGHVSAFCGLEAGLIKESKSSDWIVSTSIQQTAYFSK